MHKKKNKTPSRRNSEEEEIEQQTSSLKPKKKIPSRKNSDDEEEINKGKKKTPSRRNSEEEEVIIKVKKKHGKKSSDEEEEEIEIENSSHTKPSSKHSTPSSIKRLSHHSTPQLSHTHHPSTAPTSPHHHHHHHNNEEEGGHSEHHTTEHHLRGLSFHSIKGSLLNLFHHSDHHHHHKEEKSKDKDHHHHHHSSSSSSLHSHSSSSSSSHITHHSNPSSPTPSDQQQQHHHINNNNNKDHNNNDHHHHSHKKGDGKNRVEQVKGEGMSSGGGSMKSSSSAGNLHHQIHKKDNTTTTSNNTNNNNPSSKSSLKSNSAQDLSHVIDQHHKNNNNNKDNNKEKDNNKGSSNSSNSSSEGNESDHQQYNNNVIIMSEERKEEESEEEEEIECNHPDHHHHHHHHVEGDLLHGGDDGDEEDEEEIIKKKEIAIDCPSNGLDAFERVRLIGRGDVGKVYLVKHKLTGKPYAMKVMSKEEMVARRKIHRALTEREILISSNFPLLVTMHYSFQNDRNLYFVMDYCGGGEFFRALQRQPNHCLSEPAAKFYAAEVAMALEYLHMKGIVYRDLKPENILLQSTGHIMLTDFNLSKQSSTPVIPKVINSMFQSADKAKVELKPHLFATSLVGTEEYLAPEVVKGCAHNASLDWWTFGVLLYEMLFGVTPFKGRNREETFALIKKGNGIKFPKSPPVSMECKNLIQKLLTVNPQKRLGAEHGAADIKAHPFFRDIKWPLILNETPPIVPELSDPFDTSNFRDIEEEIEDCSTVDLRTKLADPFRDLKDVEKADHSSGVRKKDDKK